MAAEKGRRPPNAGKGRKAGVPNKFTRSVKEAVHQTFADLQGDPKANLTAWAKDNLTEFYKLSAKLIPAAVDAKVSGSLEITKVVREIVRPKNPDS